MKERPILFSAPMVRAILDGRKTQTRRVVKPQPVGKQTIIEGVAHTTIGMNPADDGAVWYVADCVNPGIAIRADNYETSGTGCGLSSSPKWKPSIHMPRWASRINLEITGIRVERLNDISEADAVAEGIEQVEYAHSKDRQWKCYGKVLEELNQITSYARLSYETLWESINGPESWSANPFVWVVEFKKLEVTT